MQALRPRPRAARAGVSLRGRYALARMARAGRLVYAVPGGAWEADAWF